MDCVHETTLMREKSAFDQQEFTYTLRTRAQRVRQICGIDLCFARLDGPSFIFCRVRHLCAKVLSYISVEISFHYSIF